MSLIVDSQLISSLGSKLRLSPWAWLYVASVDRNAVSELIPGGRFARFTLSLCLLLSSLSSSSTSISSARARFRLDCCLFLLRNLLPDDSLELSYWVVACRPPRQNPYITGALATMAAASSSVDAQVLRFTWAVELLAFWGNRMMVMATMKKPRAKRQESWSFLGWQS